MLSSISLFLLILLSSPQSSLQGQLPKHDLGVTEFLENNPEYDGRGIRVAVLDTGVDPGHPFLQVTPDGRRKIVDWYDATTDSLIKTDYRVQPKGGNVLGLSGRNLSLGKYSSMGEVRLGRIDGDFFPSDLQSRILSDRREKWTDRAREYQENKLRDGEGDKTIASVIASRNADDFSDRGPVYDVLVFKTSEGWMVVIDSDEDGDLGEERALRDFKNTGDWTTLGEESNLNYCVSVSEDGDTTHFFFDAHGHGTHVAGIIGSYEGIDSRLNGVATGVEIVAIKIGDGKVGGATSGFAVAKALDYAVEAGCQIANMSFGGPSFFADGNEPDDWVIQEAAKRGLLLVTSAGNEGPTLSTVGSPATSEIAWSIAAAIWPDTQKVSYSSLNPASALLFDFSSRGPLPNGDLGIDFAAPGAALSALPSWTLAKGESWNGTSMAAPQMAGCVSLLACAALAEGLPMEAASWHRAFSLSAQRFPQHDWVEVGYGFINMQSALDSLRLLGEKPTRQYSYDIKVNNPFGIGEGVYVRGLPDKKLFAQRIEITPEFSDDDTNADKADFLRTFSLVSESEWVLVPDAMYTSALGNSISIEIDPRELGPGLHSTRVLFYDSDKDRSLGPDIVVPVTVLVQLELDSEFYAEDTVMLNQGGIHRNFLMVPHGANYVDVTVSQEGGGRNEYRPGAGSVSAFRYYEERQVRDRFFLEDGDSYRTRIPVEAGTLFEYTMSSRWSTNRPANISLSYSFVGLHSQHSTFEVPVSQNIAYFGYTSPLHSMSRLNVSASVQGTAKSIEGDWVIIEDPIRSTIMDGYGMFQGILEFKETISDSTSKVAIRTPHSIQTTEWREDLMLEVFDSNGANVIRKIMYEHETPLGQLEPGEYLFKISFPSLGQESLKAQFSGIVLLQYQQAAKFDLFSNLQDSFLDSNSISSLTIPRGGGRTLFARVPELNPISPSSWYFGYVSLSDSEGIVAKNPIKIFREVLKDRAEIVKNEEVQEVGELELKWKESLDSENEVDQLIAVLAWADGHPEEFKPQMEKIKFMHQKSLVEQAVKEGLFLLRDFPNHRVEFLETIQELY